MARLIKRLMLWTLASLCGAIPSLADDGLNFESGKLYSIKNKVTGTSLLIGTPREGSSDDTRIRLSENLGAARLRKTETGWQILSPCGGVVEASFDENLLFVKEESDFEMQIEPNGDYYEFSIKKVMWGAELSFYLDYVDDDLIINADGHNRNSAMWEITPLPDGAIVDVPNEVQMANRTYKIIDYMGVPDYYASEIVLSDEMGFACVHEVNADKLTYTRDFSKAGWQALCAPFVLQKSDWEPFGKLYCMDKVVEEEDGSFSLKLAEVEDFVPGKPYLIYIENAGMMTVERNDGCLLSPSTGLQPDVVEAAGVRCELACVYDNTEVPYSGAGDATKSYALSGGSFKRPSKSGVEVKPYRVMLTVTSTGSAPAHVSVKTSDEGETTVIDAIETEAEPQQWYDLNGRPATRGLLISPAGKVIKR